MTTLKEAANEFLAHKRIAVAGVSRKGDVAANGIYRKLRDAGYQVFPTNPNAEMVEGDTCYPDLKSIPGGVEGVVVATHPDVSEQVVRECVEIGVNQVWLHRSFGEGSVSEEAVAFARENKIKIIPGGCPMMFVEPVDFGHKCIRWFTGLTGGTPKEV
ncbi:MAG: CoA-binding protein [Anaerolineae bacterium SG8_19]|jgi:predicted CoA-binding protein|nr:MAG: CoA-binding protein [Anaerolineae bacterium SG8_19]